MKMTKHSLQLIGGKTYICLDANEEHAMVVPLDFENAMLYEQQTLERVTHVVELHFEPQPVENVLFDPSFWWRQKMTNDQGE